MVKLKGRSGSALVAVVTIVEEEFNAVRAIAKFDQHAGGTAYLYRKQLAADEYDVILARSLDRSNTPCAELVSDLAEKFRPEFIVLSGIAGGVKGRDGITLGDVIVADHVESYEIQKMVGGKALMRRVALDHPSRFLRETITRRVRQQNKWQGCIKLPRPEKGDPKVIEGNLIAGEKLLGDQDNAYQARILGEFDKALAVDMESYGLARGVYSARNTRHYNLNYLIVRGISDLANEKGNDDTRIKWRDYAASTAAAFAVAAVDEIIACCSGS